MQDQTWQASEIYFTHESFNLQGILNDINEQNTSVLDCKQAQMKSGAPPDESRGPALSVTYRIQ